MQPIRTMSNLIEKTIISQVGVQNWKASLVIWKILLLRESTEYQINEHNCSFNVH